DEKGMEVESGLHRFLGFYEALPDLLQRAHVNLDKILHWEDEIEIKLGNDQPDAVFGASLLHKPLQTLGGVLGNNDFLNLKDKAQLAHFMAAGLVQLHKDAVELDRYSVQDWADKHNVPEQAVARAIKPFTEGVFFLSPKEHSAYVFFKLIEHAMKRPHKIRVGAFMGGMSEVMIAPIANYIEANGGEIITDAAVTSLVPDKKTGNWIVETEWSTIEAKRIVLATSLKSAQNLLRPLYANDEWFQPFLSLTSHSAVTFQIELDRPAMDVDRTTFAPTTPLASFAEQSRTTFRGSKGRLSVIFARPKEYIDKSSGQLLKEFLEHARVIGLDVGEIIDYRKIAHPHDFYSLSPGDDSKRPTQVTPIPNLFLAGDYTKQDFMATMEGAVISGERAAEAILA
ncbi:MAG: Carotene 7,8-desaturase, partial [Candidatus Saccharibacteria bacterium]|nr:Carotene 7,8-desaturase [Candidatus Saccharibacteria bacterium]